MAAKRNAHRNKPRKTRTVTSASYFDLLRSISDDPDVIAAAERAERQTNARSGQQLHPA